MELQVHVVSFEGPDPYARAGGLASRVQGLVEALSALRHPTHLWFVGDPELPGHEQRGALHLHRWCQWISAYHPGGVYDGELQKQADFAASLPPYLVEQVLAPGLVGTARAAVLAEEWHTVPAVLHLDHLLRLRGLRDRVAILWNANNTFGFERIDWPRLAAAARVTTVSRYMKHRMSALGVDAWVIPNGLPTECFEPPDPRALLAMRQRLKSRTVLVKMARWDPDKRWIETIDTVAEAKRRGWKPLLIARGGAEAHRHEVFAMAAARGLRVARREWRGEGPEPLVESLQGVEEDVVELCSHVDPNARRVLFRGAHAVLANSGHEPFGLVGLETMAAGGLACTGCSGEDYAIPGRNALVLESGDPREFLDLYSRVRGEPGWERSLRRAGVATARNYAWRDVLQRVMLPRVALHSHGSAPPAAARLQPVVEALPQPSRARAVS